MLYQCSFPVPAWQSLHGTTLCWRHRTLDMKALWSRAGPRALGLHKGLCSLLTPGMLLQPRTASLTSWGRNEEESQLEGTAIVPERFSWAGRFEPNFEA